MQLTVGFQNGAIGPAAQRLAPKDIKLGKEPALNPHHTLEKTVLEITQKYRHATEDHGQVKKFLFPFNISFNGPQRRQTKLISNETRKRIVSAVCFI